MLGGAEGQLYIYVDHMLHMPTLTKEQVKRACELLEGEFDPKRNVCTVKLGTGVLYLTVDGVQLEVPDLK